MKLRYILLLPIVLLLTSCMGIAPTQEVRKIDALNDKAVFYKYISLDSVAEYAGLAYKEVKLYDLGKAEAANNLGFYRFMIMDFERSLSYFEEVSHLTNNELELLVADIGMMKIYQRAARSKQFYDARNRALTRMKRIDEDRSVFDKGRDKQRLNYAYSEFYIVSAIYFYYLEQDNAATDALKQLDLYRENYLYTGNGLSDINQLLYYQYIKGATGLVKGVDYEQKLLNSFDLLYQTWHLARQNDIIYFEANAAQSMADMMARSSNYELLIEERSHNLGSFGAIDSLLPLRLGESALSLFEQYKDIYQIAGAYVTIGKYYNYHGCYDKALVVLSKALEVVNGHHLSYYKSHHSDEPDNLVLYESVDTDEFIEVEWIISEVLTVPEWIARIREQLSVAYSGLDNKLASDYNRNIYLDILDLVRQDKEAESRYEALQKEESLINNFLGLLLLLVLNLGVVFYLVNKHSRKKTKLYLERLEDSLQVCRDLTASLPLRNEGLDSILEPIIQILERFLYEALGVERVMLRVTLKEGETLEVDSKPSLASEDALRHTNFPLEAEESSLETGVFRVYSRVKLSKEDVSFIAVLCPYIVWAIENGLHYMDLGEERSILEKKLFITNQHNILHKRENIIKRACMRIVYGIQPYLDRVRNEVYKIVYADYAQDPSIRQYKYQYIDELLTTIQEHNELLALWIKIKQGELSLQISNFDLGELLELTTKGVRLFEQKNIDYTVDSQTVYVKADRALTLFMINTLLENARKFTSPGGSVKLSTEAHKDYVEVVVSDTGVGMTEEDIQRILHEKVYDSSKIGENNPAIKQEKGSGFGLMNCKAIIDKYRKSNALFDVCRFDIKSSPGKGSRFSFSLPYGVKKTLMLIALLFSSLNWLSARSLDTEIVSSIPIDTLKSEHLLLTDASDYADAAYFSNKDHEYEQTLSYIEQAIIALNTYYKEVYNRSAPLMVLHGEGTPAEMIWWEQQFATNYNIILDIRNEAAIAFLALKNIDGYNYNNKAYTILYKTLTKDDSLDRFCKILERSTSNKRVSLIILLFLIVSALVIYYVTYIRRRLMRRWSLEQVLDVNQTIFSSSLQYTLNSNERDSVNVDFTNIPQHILENSFTKINELLTVDRLAIVLKDREKQELFSSTYPDSFSLDSDRVEECLNSNDWIDKGVEHYIPLDVQINEKNERIGVFYIKHREIRGAKEERLFVELIVRYLATVLYNTMIRTAGRFRDINLVFDDINRLEWESNQIHVQNRVLDNCLSAIKHETIYYPSRLKQIVEQLHNSDHTIEDEQAQVKSMYDLVEYYKGIFTILTLWAKKEVELATFRRTNISVNELAVDLDSYFQRKTKKRLGKLVLNWEIHSDVVVVGDEKLVRFLFEMLINDSLSLPQSGELNVEVDIDEYFVSFTYYDDRLELADEELENLFYPTLKSAALNSYDGLPRMTYLIAKEIIREHDEFVGRRGCRIRAYRGGDGGIKLYFTLPRKSKLEKKG